MFEAILRRETLDRSKIAELSKASSAKVGTAVTKNRDFERDITA